MLFDFETLAAQDRYKLLTASVLPRPIAWVVTQDLQGRNNAAPYSFFNVFAQDPPLLVIGIGGRKPGDAKDTGNNIRETGQFVVNLVSYETADAMNITAIDFPPGVDEIAEAGLTTLPSVKIKPPRIAESPVAFECERLMTVELASDRSLVMGKVLAMHVRDDCVSNAERCHLDTLKLDLIGRMHGGGGYIRSTDFLDIPRIKLEDWERKT
jgi:flavin reductase (DIM6/NTAB) family NADH-FMN oxidoreductase RutF